MLPFLRKELFSLGLHKVDSFEMGRKISLHFLKEIVKLMTSSQFLNSQNKTKKGQTQKADQLWVGL